MQSPFYLRYSIVIKYLKLYFVFKLRNFTTKIRIIISYIDFYFYLCII